MCWAFDCNESDIDTIIWSLARREIQLKIQLRLGEKSAQLMSQHNSFVMIANAALGGEGKKGAPGPKVGDEGVKDLAAGHGDINSAVAAINRAMNFG